jgi:uncharacterized damage-inducible protein DinB
MTNREFCISRRKAERSAFLKVLKAMPPGRLDYKPEPRSRTAGQLAAVIAGSEAALLELAEKGEVEWKEDQAPGTAEAMAAAYERDAAKVDERLAGLDEAAWERQVRMLANGAPVWSDTLSQMVWGFLFDSVHHRGQLSVYLRPMGGKVPAIYGPSADDSGS